jgi:hypothetical protein
MSLLEIFAELHGVINGVCLGLESLLILGIPACPNELDPC